MMVNRSRYYGAKPGPARTGSGQNRVGLLLFRTGLSTARPETEFWPPLFEDMGDHYKIHYLP